jgi:ABC-type transport system involved in cytochrome c biogenesis permease subunit
MKQLLLPIGIGLLAPIVFILGGAPFDVPGRNPPAAFVSGSVAVILYFTATAFGLFQDRRRTSRRAWPISAGLLLSLLAVCLAVALLEGGMSWLINGVPLFMAGCVGVAVGFFLSTRRAQQTEQSHTD